MDRKEQIRSKAKELGQKYFPDEANVWARGNIEAEYVESACVEMAEWLDQHSHWIPVEEELPKCNLVDCGLATYPILVYREDGFIDISRYDSEVGEWDCIGVVTHWMPLPEAPRKEG